jgi:hypothetical protein
MNVILQYVRNYNAFTHPENPLVGAMTDETGLGCCMVCACI